ncbi:zinc-binding dehydrogenase [Pseudonocardia lutea]|uniref:Zinc-binding dehydrogenase n=1 Tax=Pseudonocardia lutea TaxID=2172015 RepID=A0ABW1ICD0_9PSEU
MVAAAVFEKGSFAVAEVELPPLGPTQLRVAPLANGICGSDLSAWAHTEDFLAANEAVGAVGSNFDPERPVVFGHEFTSRVLEVGSEVTDYAVGDVLFTLPWVVDPAGVVRTVGYANAYPGGLAAEAIVQAGGHVRLAPEVDPYLAATLEPVATGVNGVMRSGIGEGEGAIVAGAGPVGLGAVVELAARGAHPIVVSDLSARRREIALAYGATVAVDPREQDPVAEWRRLAREGSRLYVVEASAARGLLASLIESAPAYTVFSVVGSNPSPDALRTMSAVQKNASVFFLTGPAWGESRYEALWRAYDHLREGRYDPALMVTGYAGPHGVGTAFEALRPKEGDVEHVKILIRGDLAGDGLLTPAEAGLS